MPPEELELGMREALLTKKSETDGIQILGGALKTMAGNKSLVALALSTIKHTDLILHGGKEGDCLDAPWLLPWCP